MAGWVPPPPTRPGGQRVAYHEPTSPLPFIVGLLGLWAIGGVVMLAAACGWFKC